MAHTTCSVFYVPMDSGKEIAWSVHLVADLSPRRPDFGYGPIPSGFADEVAL